LYTRSKSACRNNLPLRGFFREAPRPGLDSPCALPALTIHSRSVGGYFAQAGIQSENSFKPGKIARRLFAEAGLYRHPLATLSAPARQHCGSALGLHTRPESVLLRALTPVWLESALGHEKSLLLIRSMAYGQTVSINDHARMRQFVARNPSSAHPQFSR
jgi:hypothetical protein